MPLSVFSARTRQWFEDSFEAPTTAQLKAWPAIAQGENVLLSAPTGSGKTLAAFLLGIDRLMQQQEDRRPGVGLLYVSPLKALSYDIERNLTAPLRGIGADLSVAVRSGDTSQKERQAMRRQPPDILITTPESLYLILTSQASEMLANCRSVIVDEIHAVAAAKRGAHLALTLERFEHLVVANGNPPPQRIGLSATQRPLEEIARFLTGPSRSCTVVEAPDRKRLDLKIHVPVESMVEPESIDGTEIPHLQGGEATRRSIWPAIYPKILELVREHRSTLVFVNNRRSAERIALRLNDLAEEEIARAHHGSLAREERSVVEDLLKKGELRCLVATSSLELGIDMGAIDLVLQIESPKSVARGLQRIGRSGHTVGAVSKGRIFPKFRADLLECAVVAKRMEEGAIEATVVPRNPLDVLAQQIVAMVAVEEWTVEDLYELVTKTYSFSELSRELLESVLDMLDGRYPSEEFAELRARLVWDRTGGTLRARTGALGLAVTNAGTIPDRGLYTVTLPDGRRVGELDEEMVHEARPGQTLLLGATSWRIEEIGRDRVTVTPAPGLPGAVPFWRGDGIGRPKELGEAIGAFARKAVGSNVEQLQDGYGLDPLAAENLLDFLRDQEAATGVVPSDRVVVVERFRDEIGDWRLCLLSPFGGRIHAAWSLALSRKIREELELECDAIWSDDGIIVHLPDSDTPPSSDLILIDPDEFEDLVVQELGSSALFGARFRENASRALLIPRAYPGKRTPLWQQRLKAQSLLEVAKRYPQFPIVLETYRECLRDVLDVPGTVELLRALHRRELTLVETETEMASPFASSLLFDYVASYMYEGDTPNAERRAAALSFDRELLAELLGQEELRELIDPGALAAVEAELQGLTEELKVSGPDAAIDLLRRLGDLTTEEFAARAASELDAERTLRQLESERRAVQIRVGGEARWIAADDAGLYRDALGAVPPAGLPDAFIADVPDALERLVGRYARTHCPFTSGELGRRYRTDFVATLTDLEREGKLVRGELRPGGTEREWCDPEVLRRLRRASLAALRREIEPQDQTALARFMPAWQGVDRFGSQGAGVSRLREVLVPLQGFALSPTVWERDVLPLRLGGYSQRWLDELCATGELLWVGGGPLGRKSGRVAFYFREDAAVLGPPATLRRLELPNGEIHNEIRAALEPGALFFADLSGRVSVEGSELEQALWDLVWAGEVTNDSFAPLRVTKPKTNGNPRIRSPRRARFGGRRALSTAAHLLGRWSLTAPLFAPPEDPRQRRQALAELLLERYGVLTREQVLAEGVSGGFAAIYQELSELETLGFARRGYFVEGLGGAQFALSGAVERLRSEKPSSEKAVVLAATDPAQPYGAVLPWPKTVTNAHGRLKRIEDAYVVLVSGVPVLYLERGGRSLLTFMPFDDPQTGTALKGLVGFLTAADSVKRIRLEKVNGEHVHESGLEPILRELGFKLDPRGLTLAKK